MGRARQPVNLIKEKGKTHLTKKEIQERENGEIVPVLEEIIPPSNLTIKQKADFIKIAEQLHKIELIGETDFETLERYIIARDLYRKYAKVARRTETMKDYELAGKVAKLLDRYFKQCHMCASAMGLTISSRCRLLLPKQAKEELVSKFEKFKK